MSKAIEEMKRETRIETVIQIGKYKQLTPEQIAQDLVSICELTEEAAWKEMEERCEKSERIAKELMKKYAPVIMSRHSAIERDTHDVITDDEDEVNNAGLLTIATERMAHFDRASTVSQDEMNRILGTSDADLAGFDEIELE